MKPNKIELFFLILITLTSAVICSVGGVLFSRRRAEFSGRAEGIITAIKYVDRSKSCLYTYTFKVADTEYNGMYMSDGILTCVKKVGDAIHVEYVVRDPRRNQASYSSSTIRTLEGLEGLYVAMIIVGGIFIIVSIIVLGYSLMM